MPIIDAHAHLHLRPGARERLLATMDRGEIARAVVVAGGVVSPDWLARNIALGESCDVDVDNEAIATECDASGGRLMPFFFANPHRGPAPYLAAGARFRGLKLAPLVHGVPFLDERVTALVEAAVGFDHAIYLPCLARPGFEVTDLVQLARRYTGAKFILGHAGVGNCDFYALSLIADSPRIFVETSGGFTSVCQAAIDRLGAGRVLFGTEYPLQDPRVELEKARCLALSPDDRNRYMSGNLLALIGEE